MGSNSDSGKGELTMNKEPPSVPPEDLKFEAGLELRTLDKSYFRSQSLKTTFPLFDFTLNT